MKYLVLLAVLAIVLGVWRSRQTKSESGSGSESPVRPAPPSPTPPLPQEIVACAHCGLHLPRAEALAEAGHFYCSPEHQGLGPR